MHADLRAGLHEALGPQPDRDEDSEGLLDRNAGGVTRLDAEAIDLGPRLGVAPARDPGLIGQPQADASEARRRSICAHGQARRGDLDEERAHEAGLRPDVEPPEEPLEGLFDLDRPR